MPLPCNFTFKRARWRAKNSPKSMWLIFPGLKIMHSVQIASLLRLRSPHIASTTGAGRGQFAQIQNQNASKCSALFCAIVHLWFAYPPSNIYTICMHRVLTACDFFDLIFFDWNWEHQHHLRGSSQAGGHTRLLSSCCSAVIIIPTIAYSVYFKI